MTSPDEELRLRQIGLCSENLQSIHSSNDVLRLQLLFTHHDIMGGCYPSFLTVAYNHLTLFTMSKSSRLFLKEVSLDRKEYLIRFMENVISCKWVKTEQYFALMRLCWDTSSNQEMDATVPKPYSLSIKMSLSSLC